MTKNHLTSYMDAPIVKTFIKSLFFYHQVIRPNRHLLKFKLHNFSMGASTYDVRWFWVIFDLPTYPNQMIYYISLFSKIRWSLTYLPTLKSDVICGCSLRFWHYPPSSNKSLRHIKIWCFWKWKKKSLSLNWVNNFIEFILKWKSYYCYVK